MRSRGITAALDAIGRTLGSMTSLCKVHQGARARADRLFAEMRDRLHYRGARRAVLRILDGKPIFAGARNEVVIAIKHPGISSLAQRNQNLLVLHRIGGIYKASTHAPQ